MTRNAWFRQAVGIIAENGHIEVNLVPSDVEEFISEYTRLVGRPPLPNSFSIAANPGVKGGSELRMVLSPISDEEKETVERGLGIQLRAGVGGRGYRKGSWDICMRLIAAGIDIGRAQPHKSIPTPSSTIESAKLYVEGFKKEITREISTRNTSAVEAAKRQKGYRCRVCGFDFGEFYGPHGAGFVEGHHTKPVAEYAGPKAIRADDIDPVCANCHRMLHRGERLLTIDELQQIIEEFGCPLIWPWDEDESV